MNFTKRIRELAIGAACIATMAGTASAGPKPYGKIAGYYDTRGNPTGTLSIGANGLPLETRLFSFTDFATEKNDFDDLQPPYSEVRLSRKSASGFGVAAEYNRDFSQRNGVTRVGLLCEPDLKKRLGNTFLGIKYFPASTRDHGMQVGLYGNTSVHGGDITIDGYLDHNIKPGTTVADLQIGKRISDGLSAVV